MDPCVRKYIGDELPPETGSEITWTYVTFDKEASSCLLVSVELKLPQSEKNVYALKFEDRENDGAFLTNENRGLIRQGFILILTASPMD
ncbi:unnamed protein product [Gongylonema pulchrum]|uniref:Uncharacterized protein n=1 Tax=Gongylonema pulchrum TaxID=637853 RepID=A0A3P6S8D7_9BILA|nr:unnamed protein product [Gongylonema pulchrum]